MGPLGAAGTPWGPVRPRETPKVSWGVSGGGVGRHCPPQGHAGIMGKGAWGVSLYGTWRCMGCVEGYMQCVKGFKGDNSNQIKAAREMVGVMKE